MKSDGAVANLSGSQRQARESLSPSDSKSEEGEVSEGEIRQSVNMKPAANARLSGASAAQPASLEEGESVPSPLSASTRSSSPYNPPLSVSADADVVNRAIELQKQDATSTESDVSLPSKSAAQLRVQAQGALLSLAPHNIRYNELVAEGINPAILKQLYEDVGIRIATPQPSKPAVVAPVEKPAKLESSVQAKTPKEPTRLENNNVSQQPTPSAAPSNSGKPMERKELIAKMLAAKAAKASQPTTPKEVSEEIQPAATAPSLSITPSSEKTEENGAPVKEKNKAQTELARQRIEALKKQALLKSQQRAQQLSQASKEVQPSVPLNPVPAVHHPLPVRPPAPHPSETTGLPGLSLTELNPEVESQTPSTGPAGIAVDATPLARANQRKRPLASDFDDAGTTQKKHFQAAAPYADDDSDKLIIHISDDESLYGDDEGEDMDVDSSPDQDPAPVTISTPLSVAQPPLQKSLSGTWASTSTPQAPSRPGDQEQMRQKNLEIQALHRKIAELEERRKAKLAASRTQSPRNLEDSAASPSAEASAASSAELVETPPAPSAPEVNKASEAITPPRAAIAVRPSEIDSFSSSSVQILASMDSVQLDTIRGKILHIRVIEQGLADSNSETVSSDLALCRDEADKLLRGFTEVKEERLRLIDELKNLSHEINGLTTRDLDELRRQAEMKEQHLSAQKVSPITEPAAVEKDITMSGADVPAVASTEEEVAAVAASHFSESDFYAAEPTNVDTVGSSEADELPAPSQPGHTCSVLDESEGRSSSDESSSDDSSSGESSSDESGSDEDSASEEELKASDAEDMAESVQTADDDQMQIDTPHHPLPDQPPVPPAEDVDNDEDDEDIEGDGDSEDDEDEEDEDDEEDQDNEEVEGGGKVKGGGDDEDVEEDADDYEPTDNNDQEGGQSDAESSPESEAYEPPEPDAGAEWPHSTYSPPPPAPLEDTADVEPSLDLSRIGEPLTETPRVSFLEARPVYQGSDAEILGV
jgi:hypothetical protein